MRHVAPDGEYVIEQRRVRFRVRPPWPVPGDRVMLVCQPDVYGLIVRVDDLGGDGWIRGELLGKAHGPALDRIAGLGGYD